MKYAIIILILAVNITFAQTCRLESEVPSSTPNERFTDNGDGTILDNVTGLMWQKCQLGLTGSDCSIGSATTHTWHQALVEAQASTVSGYGDWRLPNYKELLSIVEERCNGPSINTNYFPNTINSFFWSSSPYENNSSSSWRVNFSFGISSDAPRSESRYVRLVRDE